MSKWDFTGWATKNDIQCSDGRIINKDAFIRNDGEVVPLVWSHQHKEPDNVIGHALLENRPEGVYVYGKFNETKNGELSKTLVKHGDIKALSIWANNLKQQGANVIHGLIREVSLVHAGANPGAYIESVMVHGEEMDDEGYIYTGETIFLCHSDESAKKEIEDKSDLQNNKDSDKKVKDQETVGDVFDTLTEKQKMVVYAMVGQALDEKEESEDDNDDNKSKGGSDMKHNVFDNDEDKRGGFLSHSDQEKIIKMAKSSQIGSFQTALQMYSEENNLQHDALSSGFVQTGEGNISNLFPDYKEVRPGAPEVITNDQGWVTVVMNKVHKSPISRIRTSQVDIRNIDSLRARGYSKGNKKNPTGNFKLIRRTTDPQTVFVKDALYRDDVVDITDFDTVQYMYEMDRLMLNEELATAIMLGDGREDGDEAKIYPEHIRPIWLDDELYTLHVDLDVEGTKAELQGTNTGANFGSNYIYAEAIINKVLYAREKYKGTGTPDFYCATHTLNVLLLARDLTGRRIYSSKDELASALNVGDIYSAEQFEGKIRTTDDNKSKKLLGIVTNLSDYSLGATKGGEVTHFTQFDIDFNQEKSLLETRCSGALTRVYSAIALEEDVTAAG